MATFVLVHGAWPVRIHSVDLPEMVTWSAAEARLITDHGASTALAS